MSSYKQNRSIREVPNSEESVTFPGLDEASGIPNNVMWDALDDLQSSNEQLHLRAATLQAQNKDLEAYAHMVAHDLKDPLTIMIMSSDVIIDMPDMTRKELNEYMKQIRSTAYEMNNIINNLLLFAERDKAEVPVEPVDMAQVVAKVRNRLNYMIEENGTQIDFPGVWPEVIGYGPWIEEVWANYISNAIKHGGRPPYVELGASTQPDGMVRFWTRDNGPGLPLDGRALLFKAFNQIDQTRNLEHGLGLSIVLQIVKQLGGQVGVESELGKGSLFFFTLPASSTAPA
jgi:signal transduction histidine kinase